MSDIQVSVVCNTYNHKDYIRKAIESFLKQKCDFPFEIIIHDDCSTDGTKDILEEYVGKYAHLTILFEEENQFKKGIYHFKERTLPLVKGKYIALCEGDDYWTDEYKLQKQFDALENHPEINMCAHASNIVDADTEKILYKIRRGTNDRIIPIQEVVYGEFQEPVFLATASFFYRKSILENPPLFTKIMNLDFVTQLNGAFMNGIYYLADCMSDYRWFAKGCWTMKMRENREAYRVHCNKKIEVLKQFDIDSKGACHKEVEYRILVTEMLMEEDEYAILKEKYAPIYNRYSRLEKFKLHLGRKCPILKKIWALLRGRR